MRSHTTAAGLLASLFVTAAPVAAQDTAPAPKNLTFGYADGDDVVTIEVEGSDVRVLLNGKEMPASRFTHHGNLVRCSDQHGRTVAVLHLLGTGGSLQTLKRRPHRLRLGVTLRPPDEALADHLELDRNEVIYIAKVIDGKAGDKAGLRKHDVITHLDGRSPATKARLGQVLSKKKPGDVLTLRIVRKGGSQEIDVELEAEAQPPQDWLTVTDSGALQQLWEPNWTLPQYLGQMQNHGGFLPFTANDVVGEQGNLVDVYSYLLPDALGTKSGFAEVGDENQLRKQLRTLEKRLDSLEKLLKGLDKKLK